MAARFFSILLCVTTMLIGCTEKKVKDMDLKIHHPKVNIELDPQKMEDAFSMLLSTQLYRGCPVPRTLTGLVPPTLTA